MILPVPVTYFGKKDRVLYKLWRNIDAEGAYGTVWDCSGGNGE